MSTYTEHVATLQLRWREALSNNAFDAALISAGTRHNYFLDDQAPPFRANPHLAQWFDGGDCEHSLLLIKPDRKPRLYFYQPRDYWHQPPTPPAVDDAIDVRVFDSAAGLADAAYRDLERENRVALIGEPTDALSNLPVAAINPERLLNHLHYVRACKTAYEIDCMRIATRIAVTGHLAARAAFAADASEFDIHRAYLDASRQSETELPYSSIVALNEHAAVLHYQHYDRVAPAHRHSLLIDAGGRFRGYASDITRTYSARDGEFAALIAALDSRQRALIDTIRIDTDFVALHETMHRGIAELLVEFGLVSCSAEQAFDDGITDTFLPHGLGHLIGLQTHDVAGHMVSRDGGMRQPPHRYPALRLTRPVADGHVFTIEPGLYFIPMLLDALRASAAGNAVNWASVERFLPYGGIRIEDNVLVQGDRIVNLTRDAFAAAESA
jgi:Xaa-Pro dipeptidase